MEKITGLDYKIKEMAARIRELREIENLSVAEMAIKTDVSESEYLACENGESDLIIAFIYRHFNKRRSSQRASSYIFNIFRNIYIS